MELGWTHHLAGFCCPDNNLWSSGLTKGVLTCGVLVKTIALEWDSVGSAYKVFASYSIPEGGALSALMFTKVAFINF